MEKVLSYFTMTIAAFVFWQSSEQVRTWMALYQDEKRKRLKSQAETEKMWEERLRLTKQNDRLP